MEFKEICIGALVRYKYCTFLPEYAYKICIITSYYENFPTEAVNVTFLEDKFDTTVWIKNLYPLEKMIDKKDKPKLKILYKVPRLVIED